MSSTTVPRLHRGFQILANILDWLTPEPRKISISPDAVPPYSMAASDVLALYQAKISTAEQLPQSPFIHRLTTDIVAKVVPNEEAHEAYITHLVGCLTSIPVPRILGVCLGPFGNKNFIILMQYVEGTDIQYEWHKMSWWRKIWVIWTLRGYVRQLRTIPLPNPHIPGPFDTLSEHEHRPRQCVGHGFDENGSGPFPSLLELRDFWTECVRQTWWQWGLNSEHNTIPSRVNWADHLVLTHGDIHEQNVRIGKDGRLWLLDWGSAGAYPRWLESTAIHFYYHPFQPGLTWDACIPLIAGYYPVENRFMRAVEYTSN